MAKKQTPAPASSRQAKIRAAQGAQGGGANRVVVAAVVVVVAIVAVVGGVVWSQSQKDSASGTSTAVPKGTSMGQGYRAFADVTPQPGAPTVDLYEDFQCPVCSQFEEAVGATVTGLAQQGRIVLNYHVLNFLDDKMGVQFSTPAANGAFCAADGGRFQDFHDAVYADQAPEGTTLDDATLEKWATAAGIDGDALTTWKQCVADGTYTRYVTSVNEAAFALPGFAGTPTVVINGTTADLGSVATPEGFTAAVQGATS